MELRQTQALPCSEKELAFRYRQGDRVSDERSLYVRRRVAVRSARVVRSDSLWDPRLYAAISVLSVRVFGALTASYRATIASGGQVLVAIATYGSQLSITYTSAASIKCTYRQSSRGMQAR